MANDSDHSHVHGNFIEPYKHLKNSHFLIYLSQMTRKARQTQTCRQLRFVEWPVDERTGRRPNLLAAPATKETSAFFSLDDDGQPSSSFTRSFVSGLFDVQMTRLLVSLLENNLPEAYRQLFE